MQSAAMSEPVERRRAQVREAQRRYRQKQEAQVRDLKGTITALITTFTELNDCLLSGASPQRMNARIKSATEHFAEHAKNLDLEPQASVLRNQSALLQTKINSLSPNTALWTLPSTTAVVTTAPISAPATTNTLPTSQTILSAKETCLELKQADWSIEMDFIQSFTNNLGAYIYATSGPAPYGIPPPMPFELGEIEERTFARRLHRYALITGYNTLRKILTRPEMQRTEFPFTQPISIPDLFAEAKDVLCRGAFESLDWQQYAFQGGVDTHTREPYFSNAVGPERPGLRQMPPEFKEVDGESKPKLIRDNEGHVEEWLTSWDVEKWLQHFQIFLHGGTTPNLINLDANPFFGRFVVKTGVVSEIIQEVSGTSPPNGLSNSTDTHSQLVTSPAYGQMDMSSTSIQSQSQPAFDRPLGYFTPWQATHTSPSVPESPTYSTWSTAQRSHPPYVMPPEPILSQWQPQPVQQRVYSYDNELAPLFPTPYERPRKSVTFNIEAFLREIVSGGACLGHTPGFRKAAAERALNAAIYVQYEDLPVRDSEFQLPYTTVSG